MSSTPTTCLLIDTENHASTFARFITWLSESKDVSVTVITQHDTIAHHRDLVSPDLVMLSNQLDETVIEAMLPELDGIPTLLLYDSKAEERNQQTGQHTEHWLSKGIDDIAIFRDNPAALPEDCYSFLKARLDITLQHHRALKRVDTVASQMSELHDTLEQRNQQVEKELYLARQLQQSLLPAPLKNATESDELTFQFSKQHYASETLRISGLYVPCDALGGDLYDFITFKHDDSISIIMADVSGHGITAGFITAIFKALYHQAAHQNASPDSVMTYINDELSDIIKTGDYITSVGLRTIPKDNRVGFTLQYSGGGHPFPYFYQTAEKETIRLDKNSMPLGWFGGTEYPCGNIDLNPGDKLLLFTDGITELKNHDDELFGEERLHEVFTEQAQQFDEPFLDYLLQELSDFTQGKELDDDLSMLLIEAL
jgi:serine phosphatase RsbU (regulator of sigma subunit)